MILLDTEMQGTFAVRSRPFWLNFLCSRALGPFCEHCRQVPVVVYLRQVAAGVRPVAYESLGISAKDKIMSTSRLVQRPNAYNAANSSARLVAFVSILLLAICGRAQTAPESSGPITKNSSFSEPLTPVESNGKWGFQDKSGAFVVPPQFERVKSFSEGLATVELHKKFGYVNTSGHVVIAPQFAYADPFSDGLALVYTTLGMNILGTEGWDLFRRAGYIDHAGRFVIGPRYVENAASFSEGVAAFQPGAVSPGNAKWGYLDKSGKWAIKPRFDIAGNFSEGLAAVSVSPGKTGDLQKSGHWGYIDHAGELVIPPQFRTAFPFKKGIATVFVWDEGSRRPHRKCIDKQGSSVTCPPPERRPMIPTASRPINMH
jgi:WG containing repeat